MTTYNTGTNQVTVNSPSGWKPQQTIIGASQAYNFSFGALNVWRSNAGTAMTDTLPLISASTSDGESGTCPNGFYIKITNTDTSASLTVSATSGNTINGSTNSSVISPGASVTFTVDATLLNWYTDTGVSATTSVVTGSPVNLGLYTQGSTVIRSNATTAMADTLPVATSLPANWYIYVMNVDASATDTITPVTSTINGASTLAITYGKSTRIAINGANYVATTPA